jgi:hypothetical protein
LKIYDILGIKVAELVNEEKSPGTYEVEFDPAFSNKYQASGIQDLASGIYFYQLRSGDFIETKKMILLR